jgi:hypothetical protein
MRMLGSNNPNTTTRGLFRFYDAITKRSTTNAQNQQLITQLQKKGLISVSKYNSQGKTHVEFDVAAINTHLNELLKELKQIGGSTNRLDSVVTRMWYN